MVPNPDFELELNQGRTFDTHIHLCVTPRGLPLETAKLQERPGQSSKADEELALRINLSIQAIAVHCTEFIDSDGERIVFNIIPVLRESRPDE